MKSAQLAGKAEQMNDSKLYPCHKKTAYPEVGKQVWAAKWPSAESERQRALPRSNPADIREVLRIQWPLPKKGICIAGCGLPLEWLMLVSEVDLVSLRLRRNH